MDWAGLWRRSSGSRSSTWSSTHSTWSKGMHPRTWPKELLIGLRLTLCTAALALIYTFVVTGISQVAFNANANGSLVTVNGKAVGSALIGQSCPQEKLASD